MSLIEERRPGIRRVLVVDDTDDDREIYAAMLRAAGYHVEEARSAIEAMRIVLNQPPPDAVVLDLVLPDWHGIEVARAFKATMPTRNVCVVAMTSSPGSVDFVDPHSFGAETILIKPVAPERMLLAVARCFDDTAVLERLAWLDPSLDEEATS